MKSMSSYSQIEPVSFREDLPGDILAGDAFTMTQFKNSRTVTASMLDPEIAWKQLVARDLKARFVYGVTTTGVFCRPGCASRRPLRENVRFFCSVVDAQAAGFRACKRCAIAWSSPLDEIRAAQKGKKLLAALP